MDSSRFIASDLSYEVLQLRARRLELGTQALDSSNQRLAPLPSKLAQFDSFVADRDVALDQAQLRGVR